MDKLKVVIVGAGNVARHYARHMVVVGHEPIMVYNHQMGKALELANELNVPATDKIEELPEADLYFMAVKDDVIKELADRMSVDGMVVHCSGTQPLSALEQASPNIGILYPLQTFTHGRKVDMDNVPIFYNANNDNGRNLLRSFAVSLSNTVFPLTDQRRAYLHLAAVLVNNFGNHLYSLAEKITDKHELRFEWLMPLLLESVNKLKEHSPSAIQTGPAKRRDGEVIERHLTMLEDDPDVKELYELFTKQIMEG